MLEMRSVSPRRLEELVLARLLHSQSVQFARDKLFWNFSNIVMDLVSFCASVES